MGILPLSWYPLIYCILATRNRITKREQKVENVVRKLTTMTGVILADGQFIVLSWECSVVDANT